MTALAHPRVVTLLTDFGLSDAFVGIMKGVLLREAPGLAIIDVSHGIPAQDTAAGAFVLAQSFGWFPEGSVHVCVVDPGVGSARAALVAEARGHTFVAPDNGVLTAVLETDPAAQVRRVDLARLGLSPKSRTFHGRDVFAPLSAWLASGRRSFAELGELCVPERCPFAQPVHDARGASGQVLFVDHFGNLISNLPSSALASHASLSVEVGGRVLRVVGTYSEAEPGECVALVSSFDTLEIAERNGNAARALGLERGAPIRVEWGARP